MADQPPEAMFEAAFNCCSVEFSPFHARRLAVASAQYFGIIGNGRQYVLEAGPDGGLHVVRDFLTHEGLYDCSWSEVNGDQLVSASADGSLKLWDVLTSDDFPVAQWAEHTAEASSVDWNLVAKDTFVSASWDSTIKLWDPQHPHSVATYTGHQGGACVYNALWSPRHPKHFVSCAGDGSLRVWDASSAGGAGCLQVLKAHEGEVLSVDWDKYNDAIVYSGGVDHAIKAWDLRRPQVPLSIMHGHGYAVRRLKSSPWREGALASVSYDMSCRTWAAKAMPPETWRCDFHSEFVQGLDFNLFNPEQIATCSWDRRVCLWRLPPGVVA